MDENYSRYLHGTFLVNERYIKLYERLEKYYKDTPDSMSNKDAFQLHNEFKEWCDANGYSRKEIVHVKKNMR